MHDFWYLIQEAWRVTNLNLMELRDFSELEMCIWCNTCKPSEKTDWCHWEGTLVAVQLCQQAYLRAVNMVIMVLENENTRSNFH